MGGATQRVRGWGEGPPHSELGGLCSVPIPGAPPPPSLHSVHPESGAPFRGGLSLCPPSRAAGQLQAPSSPPPAIRRAPDQPLLGSAPPGGCGHCGRRARPGCFAGPAVLEASERAEVSEGRATRRWGDPGWPPTTPSPLQGREEPALPGADGLQPVVSTPPSWTGQAASTSTPPRPSQPRRHLGPDQPPDSFRLGRFLLLPLGLGP